VPRYLVTGGAGFIGSHLVDRLIEDGHEVRVLDDLSTGHRANLHRAAKLEIGSVTNAALVRRLMRGCQGCYHLAAISSVAASIEDWLGTHRVNLGGSVSLFDAAARESRESGAAVPVVYASSAAIYGDNQAERIEESAPAAPLTGYGADKLGTEQQARIGGQVHGLPSFGLRLFNIYGPRQDPASPYSGVISIFADRARRGAAITIFGDGGQTRDFVYVADAVEAFTRAMARAEAASPIVNIATGRQIRIDALAGLVCELAGRPVRIGHAQARPGDIRRSCGAPDAAHGKLGWQARWSLSDGLRAVVENPA